MSKFYHDPADESMSNDVLFVVIEGDIICSLLTGPCR